MAEIISIDFKTKRRIEEFTIYKWNCVVCSNIFTNDSRNKNNMGRVENRYKNNFHICAICAKEIAGIVKEEGW